MNSVRDMGLAMWQEKYGKTAMGKPGGAIGSFNPLDAEYLWLSNRNVPW
jgi:hypothetical protein